MNSITNTTNKTHLVDQNSSSLHDLGLLYKTDKATFHEYTKFYQTHFDALRYSTNTVLEIGVRDGASLFMWRDYFVNAKIYGVDNQNVSHLKSDRIDIFQLDQENVNELRKLPTQLDLIIDDGGHTMLQQQTTFKILLLENLRSGGVYVLEDLHTSLPAYQNTCYGSNAYNNTLSLLLDLKRKTLSLNNEYHVTPQEFEKLLADIKHIDIFYNGPERDNSVTSIIIKN